MRLASLSFACAAAIAAAACQQPAAPAAGDAAASATAPKLGIRAVGDEEIAPDMSQVPPDLKLVFDHIDENIDQHVANLQEWIRQPSISNSGEGIPESAEMVKGFFDEFGCQQTQVYDVGVTEYGTPGNPVVYAKCDEGAEQAPFKKVLIGRGATNSKGPQMTQFNALRAIKAVHGKLPVNLIIVAEGDEERMDIGLRKWVKDHPELLEGADAMVRFGGGSPSGNGGYGGGSEGCVYVELTTSGTAWGRGPTVSDIHGSNKRGTDSPAWRHIKMLASLVSDDGNTPKIDGFFDGIRPLTPQQEASLRAGAKNMDLEVAAQNLGVARFMSDDPYTVLKTQRYGTSFNLDGIWGGNMYAGGAGAILPNKITSKHNFRYVPGQNGLDIVKKLRAQLDKNGYKDVEVKLIGDVPWALMNSDNEIGRAMQRTYEIMGIQHGPVRADWGIGGGGAAAGGYWPAYMFSNGEVGEKISPFKGVPIVMGGAGLGGRAHAANEYYVIEGAGKVYGMAGAEKAVATTMYAFAGKIPAAPAKSTN